MAANKFLMVSMAMALAAAPGAVEAQTGPISFGISGGPSFPTGHFAEEAQTGYHVQGSLGLSLPLLPVGVRADLLWQDFQDDNAGAFTQVAGLLNATAGLSLLVARPYVIAGAGLVHDRAPEGTHIGHTHAAEKETVFGFNAGAGVEFPFVGLTGVVEARYLDAGEERRSIPVSVGIRF